ncbi:MAG: hypothetical protein GX790_01275 [Syntrophomonadaceae bacterium]|nr:hypothetical protein [Syntrophomonadaceae bacterium]
MGQALAKKRSPRPQTMHDGDYNRVFKTIEKVRRDLEKGQLAQNITCPICGRKSVFISQREVNTGHVALVAMCSDGCFTAWE